MVASREKDTACRLPYPLLIPEYILHVRGVNAPCFICSEKMLSAWHGYLMYVKCNELKIVIVEKNQENVLL